MLLKGEVRAVEYRTRARAAMSLAQVARLEQVRQGHEIAAAVWIGLAEDEDRRAEQLHTGRFVRPAPAKADHAFSPDPSAGASSQ